jgi:hypothetical protein
MIIRPADRELGLCPPFAVLRAPPEDNNMRKLVTNLGVISFVLLWQTGSASGIDTTWGQEYVAAPCTSV